MFNYPGWIQVLPIQRDEPVPIDVLTQAVFEALLRAVGGPVGGPLDCTVHLADTLPMQVASLQVDLAPADAGAAKSHFFVAVYGALGLPPAAQWSAVRIDGATQGISPVDARRGVPVLRRFNKSHFIIIDPAEALKAHPKARYGLLVTSEASGVPTRSPLFTLRLPASPVNC